MILLSKIQWAKVVDRMKAAGFFSTVELSRILTYFLEGGLSKDEKDLIMKKGTADKKMMELERWLRLRPHLLEALRNALQDMNLRNILEAVDETVAAVQEQGDTIEDPERFRLALRYYQRELSEVGEWLVVNLWMHNSITSTEKSNLTEDPAQLVDVLLKKSTTEWQCLLACLKDKHKGLYLWFIHFINPASTAEPGSSEAEENSNDSSNPLPSVGKNMFKQMNSVQNESNRSGSVPPWRQKNGGSKPLQANREKSEATIAVVPWNKTSSSVQIRLEKSVLEPTPPKPMRKKKSRSVQIGIEKPVATPRKKTSSSVQVQFETSEPTPPKPLKRKTSRSVQIQFQQPVPTPLPAPRKKTSSSVQIQLAASDAVDGGEGADIGSTMWLEDCPPVTVTVAGSGSFLLPLRPSDILGPVIAALRRRCALMCVQEVRLGESGLNERPGWKQRSLADNGMSAGDKLTMEPFLPDGVQVAVWQPTRRAPSVRMVPIGDSSVSWNDIKTEVESGTGRKIQSAVLLQEGGLCVLKTHSRQSLVSFDSEKKELRYLDEDTGEEEDVSNCSFFTWDFLRPDEIIAATPKLMPRLGVFASCQLCTVEDDRTLTVADKTALFDASAVLLLHGLSLNGRNGERISMKLLMCNGRLTDAESGTIHDNEEEATKEDRPAGATWRRLLIVIKAGNPLPHCRLPKNELLWLRTRRGVSVTIAKNRVAAAGVPGDPTASRWEMTRDISQIQKDVSRAVRRE